MKTLERTFHRFPARSRGRRAYCHGLRMSAGIIALTSLAASASAQRILAEIEGNPLDGVSEVVSPGDIDGDGTSDLLVGAPGHAKIRLYSGRMMQLIYEIQGAQTVVGSNIGNSMSGLGDFNGDGIPDFVAGDPYYHTQTTWAVGAVRVYSGLDGSEIGMVHGSSTDEQLGSVVAGLGDINGDGIPDVAAAARLDQVVIYGGPDLHVIRTHTNVSRRPSVTNAGDLDGDSLPDYAVGWPEDATNGIYSGRVTVHSGRSGELIHEVYGDTGWNGENQGDKLGVSVAGVGDIDADGLPDFAAGAPGRICVGGGCGPSTEAMVRVYSGLDAHVIHEWDGAVETDQFYGGVFGYRVYGGGDVNGDGTPDVLVGAPYDTPPSKGSISVYSGRTGERLWRILGVSASTNLYTAAILGDLSQSDTSESPHRFADFAVGDPSGFKTIYAGRVTVYSGDPGELQRHCASAPTSTSPGIRIDSTGAISVGNNFLTLHASDAVPGQPALFFYGPITPRAPFGDGWRCTGPPYFRLGPSLTVDGTGHVERALQLTLPPLSDGPGRIDPGSTWSFQLFCRDPGGPGGTGLNLSDALAITFPP